MFEKAEIWKLLDNFPERGEPVLIPLSHHHITIEQPVGLVAAVYGFLAPPKPF